MAALTRDLAVLPPGATVPLEIEATEGTTFGFDPDSRPHFYFSIGGSPAAETQVVSIWYADDACEPSGGQLAPGRVTFEIENVTDRAGRFAVAWLPPGAQCMMLTFAPFLSAKRLLTTQTFRDLFRSEVIRATEGIGVREMLAPCAVEREVTQLKGIIQHLPVFRVTTRAAVIEVGTVSGGQALQTDNAR